MIGFARDEVGVSVTPSKLSRVSFFEFVIMLKHRNRAIEDNVLLTCADIVPNCVVVGHYKPSVVLLVEPNAADTGPEDALKETIMSRTQEFRSRQFIHERLKDTKHIVVASRGSLPRTKVRVSPLFSESLNMGSCRRKAISGM